MSHLWGARCGDPGGDDEGDRAGVAGAEAARLREYSLPPTAIADPLPPGSVTRVMGKPDADRVGRDGTIGTKPNFIVRSFKRMLMFYLFFFLEKFAHSCQIYNYKNCEVIFLVSHVLYTHNIIRSFKNRCNLLIACVCNFKRCVFYTYCTCYPAIYLQTL